jgi:hypothetical protein
MGTNITGIGNANAIGFKSRVTGGAYFPPELKDALVGVWSAYGKSNDSTDRNIIKNKIKDRGGDFVISNAAYKLNSGYGKYEEDFTDWRIYPNIKVTDSVITTDGNFNSTWFIYKHSSESKINEMNIKVSGIPEGGKILYFYISDETDNLPIKYTIPKDGIYHLPESKINNNRVSVGFTVESRYDWNNIRIEQIPSFEGAFVTDGIDDLITSTKTVQEMGITDEVTVVSMIHQIDKPSNFITTNNIRASGSVVGRNAISLTDKTGIYGWYKDNIQGSTINVINNILGDKADYTASASSNTNLSSKFSVVGYISNDSIVETSQVAWYWTIIANKVLTTDEINQVIAYYNLDRPGEIVKPQVYYNIKKQKISNDNHSAFDDKLIDYSGNGYDAKLYNFGWKEDSGIGKYETDFTSWLKSIKITSLDSESFSFISDVNWTLLYYKSNIGKDMPSFKVKIKLDGDGAIYYNYITQEGILTNVTIKTEEFETPISYNTKYTGETPVNVGFTMGVRSGECSGTITQIPEYKDALIFDGIDDYGKVTGLPILKDYTFLVDRQIINIGDVQRIVASKSESATDTAKQGAFLFEYLSKNSISTWSYYENNPLVANADFNRDISYQSKYIYNGKELTIGGAGDSDKLWLGTIRDNDSRFFNGAIYLLMLFPYSMSEFLIERQIEKVKGGTLYPNQVEFRPIIPEDENITKIDYFVVNSGTWTVIKPGDYVDVGARIVLNVYTKLPYKIAGASSTAFTGMTVGPSTALNIWDVKGYIKDKTPQKIKLTLAVNEDIIQWNPTISANIPDSYDAVTEWFANGWETKIAVGDWIKKSDRIFFKLKLKEPLHEIGKVTFGGSECQATKASNWSESNNLWEIVTYSSVGDLSQVFNVQVDEYIRFEDIVQPYPILLRFNNENGSEVSWGGKFRVGSTITRIGSIADPESNLLNGLYSISGLTLNGKAVTSSISIVEKQMVFKTTATWLLDNNGPKCILSPNRLRIPNSSYKILGHIPDISGHGNHGEINNSAYEGESGADGYSELTFNNWRRAEAGRATFTISNDVKLNISKVIVAKGAILYTSISNYTTNSVQKYKVTGVDENHPIIFGNDSPNDVLLKVATDGEYEINWKTYGKSPCIFTTWTGDCNITIEQIGKYEGAFCFDGVDDFVTIPTTVGGKQVLMKVNSRKSDCYLYDQRNNWTQYLGIVSTKDFIAYNYSNQRGKTYIDGILNENITANDLISITHNITVTNNRDDVEQYSPCIGTSFAKNSFSKMSLYDFMLFDEISTDDKIKELNEYVGIEGNVFEFNPTFTIDLPMAIKSIKVYQGGNEISPGYLYPNKDTEFEVYVSLNDGKYAVDTITVDDVEITKDRVVGEYNIFKFTLNGSSEQKITIHSYEYIMYEDIIQPYPSFVKLENLDRTHTYTWGDKLRIGDTIRYNSSKNLLEGAYTLRGQLECNGVYVFDNNQQIVVTKEMVFAWSHSPVWTIGNSAPKCVFSPSKLRIPNSSYKYLGYIPDISGNGNNGTFYNFAYEGMSGANGYSIIFGDNKTYQYLRHSTDFNPTTINFAIKSINAYTTVSLLYSYIKQSGGLTSYNKYIPSYKIRVSGIKEGFTLKYTYIKNQTDTSVSVFDIVSDGVHIIPPSYQSEGNLTNNDVWIGFTLMGTFSDLYNITVEVLPDYEGSICFDGVDDYIKIDTTGGMTMLMKANVMSTTDRILYDQRDKNSEGNMYKEFAVLTSSSDSILAYAGRNPNGKTYIDGVLNTNITCGQLLNITHNITALPNSNLVGTEQGVRIGASVMPASYCKAAVFDFMLFDTKCTDDVIKQLNDIIGIEGNYVQRPPYYWDAYGKSNLDGDRGTIPQLGTAEDYSFASFDNEQDWQLYTGNTSVDVVSRSGYSINLKRLTNTSWWAFQNAETIGAITRNIPFKIKANKAITVCWDCHGTKADGSSISVDVTWTSLTPNKDTTISLGYLTKEQLAENEIVDNIHYKLWFYLSKLAIDEEVTIEMLPVEGGRNLWLNNYGIAYDKMSGYGGYTLGKFTNSWSLSNNSNSISIVARNPYDITLKKLGGNSDWEFNTTELKIISNPVSVKFKSDKNIRFTCDYHYYPVGENSEGTPLGITSKDLIANEDAIITISPISQENIDKYNIDINRGYYLVYFQLSSTLAINEEVTIEMLPIYPNGLVFDGVDDYSRNINVPAFTDFTYVFKRKLLDNAAGCASMNKGLLDQQRATVIDYVNTTGGINGTSFGNMAFVPSLRDGDIIYSTTTNINGTSITKGSNPDSNGIDIGKFATWYKKMVFYKLMLYPRTTNMLTINMIKNMMAEDNLIDIQGKLFTDKFTGDFNLDFNKDFLIGN